MIELRYKDSKILLWKRVSLAYLDTLFFDFKYYDIKIDGVQYIKSEPKFEEAINKQKLWEKLHAWITKQEKSLN